MSTLLDYCPQPPDGRLAWDDMEGEYDWLVALRQCPQDPEYHAEGDVGVHTHMVCQELTALSAWRELPAEERRVVFAAAVLHDVGKPDCTRVEETGGISSRGHSRRGAVLARQLLWHQHVPFADREQVAGLIRHHQAPYYLIDRPDAERLAITISQTARCDHLAILAEADIRGRICATKAALLDNVLLFAAQVGELGCLREPFAFPSSTARVLYFRDDKRHPLSPVAECRGEVVLMSGLPGAGKDHFIRGNYAEWPVVSLDQLRQELGVDPTDEQGTVVAAARERARVYLRRGERFVWNGTNVSRQLRTQVIDLFLAYQARVTIAYVEPPPEVWRAQNRERAARVPEAVLGRMLDRWEVPDATEAHAVEYHVRDTGT